MAPEKEILYVGIFSWQKNSRAKMSSKLEKINRKSHVRSEKRQKKNPPAAGYK